MVVLDSLGQKKKKILPTWKNGKCVLRTARSYDERERQVSGMLQSGMSEQVREDAGGCL